MLMGKVTGSVWATRKHPRLEGQKHMTVCVLDRQGREKDALLVAVDLVGAGVGETVLVVTGSGARTACGRENLPVDAAIVGIIDVNEINNAGM